VPQHILEQWMENPDVDGWCIGTRRVSGPLFACTEACDTATFRDSALRYLRDKGEILHCWTLSA
ncbi:TRPT1, partial [Symbiodinium sp. KB8]